MQENPWTIRSSTLIYENPWIAVTEFDVLNPKGNEGIYGKVSFKNKAVGIVAMDNEHYIYLVGQYRFSLEQYSWELPEGGCPAHEDPLSAAQRELAEETGIKADVWTHLLDMHLSNSITDEHGTIFLATELTFGLADPEETEELTLKRIHLDEALQMIYEGRITDSLTVAGLLRIKLMTLEK